jgi:hypothetical protein
MHRRTHLVYQFGLRTRPEKKLRIKEETIWPPEYLRGFNGGGVTRYTVTSKAPIFIDVEVSKKRPE